MSTLETRSPLSALQVTCVGISSCLCGLHFVNMDFNSCWPYPCAGGHLVRPDHWHWLYYGALLERSTKELYYGALARELY